MRRWSLIILACLCTAARLFAAEAVEDLEVRHFEVFADDRPIGSHSLQIWKQNDRTTVVMKSNVALKVLLIRYSHMFDGQEVWDGSSLIAAEATTNANGKKFHLRLKGNGDKVLLQCQDRVVKADAPQMTTAYSRLPPGIRHEQKVRLLDLDDGELATTIWRFAGNDELIVADRRVPCGKWEVTGELEAELWFDAGGWLVRQKTVEQGHPAELRLTSILRERAKP